MARPGCAHTEIIAEAASSFVGVVATLNDHLVGEEDEVRTVASEDQFEDALESVSDDDEEEEEEETREDVLRSGGEAGGRFVNDSAKNSTHDLEEEEPVEEAFPSASGATASGDNDASLHDRLRLELRKLDRRASAFLEAVPVPLCLGILSQIEVLSEMVAKRRARRRGGQNPEEEALGRRSVRDPRACLKTALWSRQGGKMLVDDGLSPDQLGDEDARMDLLAAAGARGKPETRTTGFRTCPPASAEPRSRWTLCTSSAARARERAARERAEARRREEEGESGESPDVDDDGDARWRIPSRD